MSSTSKDAVFAILESAASRADKSSVEAKLRVLVRMAVEDALGIESLQKVSEFARKKQVVIVEEGIDAAQTYVARYKEEQLRLDNIKQLQDMLSIITILEQNAIESDKDIYEGMPLKDLAEQVYEELLRGARSSTPQPVPASIKEKLGSLLQTKKMNPASFFSWSFKCGVYVPIMAPFAFPLALTLVDLLRRALFAKI